jgi:hypothetical protein
MGTPSRAGHGGWRTRWMLALVGLCSLISLSTRAAPEKLAVHPLVVREVTEREELEYRRIFYAEVVRLQKNVVAPAAVKAFLKRVPHQTCVSAPDLNKCLADLAKHVKAKSALFVTLNPYPRIRLAGRLVRDTGEVRASAQNEYGKLPQKNPREAVRRVLRQFLAELRVGVPDVPPLVVGTLPKEKSTDKPIVSAPPPAPSPPVSVAPRPAPQEPLPLPTSPPAEPEPTTVGYVPEEGWSWQKSVGVGLATAGVVGLGLGTYFKIRSSHSWNEFNNTTSSGYLTPIELNNLRDIQSRAQSQGTAGNILLVGGGALTAGGLGLLIWEIARPKGETVVSVAPMPGGLIVAGEFQ